MRSGAERLARRASIALNPRGIAGVEPPSFVERLPGLDGTVPVAGHHIRAAHEQLAGLVGCAPSSVRSDGTDIDKEGWLARRTDLAGRALWVEQRHDGRRLGQPVPLEKQHASLQCRRG